VKPALQSLIVSMRSRRTTVAGTAFGALLCLLAIGRPLWNGTEPTETQWMFATVGLGLAVSGLLARDGDKSSEDVGARKDDTTP
jgi:hypothetical protein